jgi:hypothetical protein
MAVQRLVDVLKTRLKRDAVSGKKRQLRRAARQTLECGEAVVGGKLADGVHPGVEIEWGQA